MCRVAPLILPRQGRGPTAPSLGDQSRNRKTPALIPLPSPFPAPRNWGGGLPKSRIPACPNPAYQLARSPHTSLLKSRIPVCGIPAYYFREYSERLKEDSERTSYAREARLPSALPEQPPGPCRVAARPASLPGHAFLCPLDRSDAERVNLFTRLLLAPIRQNLSVHPLDILPRNAL